MITVNRNVADCFLLGLIFYYLMCPSSFCQFVFQLQTASNSLDSYGGAAATLTFYWCARASFVISSIYKNYNYLNAKPLQTYQSNVLMWTQLQPESNRFGCFLKIQPIHCNAPSHMLLIPRSLLFFWWCDSVTLSYIFQPYFYQAPILIHLFTCIIYNVNPTQKSSD